ncbi:hypothetical protein DFP72DRAFT_992920 [Ephemerocybe angulata]|uniref:Uncharacterized protein n=1 Tax=Ephemerocybe angulata TaxID=980116 RepID=A0A8H6H607_9AGAR|nr:hypothetical protein DFP72DRAFT_835314 [Tulosesus angulatus]KAF6746037.1 hypothetical protein DFP72DRAFT_992920 [Tulosesus angulatus]
MSALEQYAAYSFGSDQEYQQGLASIMLGWSLDKAPSAETREEMLRRTRVFYFNKVTGNALTMDEARDYERSLLPKSPDVSQSPPPKEEEEHRVLSFAELKELIESGNVDKIPNNKIIPEKLSEEAPSHSTAAVRRKPWETAAEPDTSIPSS